MGTGHLYHILTPHKPKTALISLFLRNNEQIIINLALEIIGQHIMGMLTIF